MVPHTSSGRGLLALLLLAALLLAPRPVSGAWSTGPVLVHSTTADCPQVAACGDGAYGAIVVWQENSAGSAGPLHARHLLGSGDVDPAWPAPASVCATASARSALGAVTDRAGGAYVWWLAGSAIYLTHVGPDGAITAGWPAAGRSIGTQFNGNARPTVLADGSGGVYLSWLQFALADMEFVAQLRVTHLGPANTGVAGSPPGGRTIGLGGDHTECTNTGSIGLAPDGGVWVALGTTVLDPNLGLLPGEWRLTRLLPSLMPAAGWTTLGATVGEFRGDLLDPNLEQAVVPDMSLVGVASDGADGAYVVRGEPADPIGDARLFHFGADGTPVAGWPVDGVVMYGGAYAQGVSLPGELSIRAFPDGRGGVWAGRPDVYENGASYSLHRFDVAGATSLSSSLGASWQHLEIAQDGAGSLFLASCVPTGPYGWYDPYATVGANGGPNDVSWGEYHPDILVHWYGDEGLATTEDGGAILVWSQVHDRFGLFAVRLGAGGLVTDVPPASAPRDPRLRLRFVPGAGLGARATFESAGRARWALYDVTGRALASREVEVVAGANEWTLEGTDRLPSGLYFASVTGAGARRTARVIVAR